MMPPYEHPGANVAFWTLFGFFALGEFVIRFRSRINKTGTRAEGWSLLVVIAAVVGGMLAGIALASPDVGSIVSARWPLFVVGLVLMAVGIFIRQWAVFTLGRFFTADVRVHPGQTVVERGPYRWVRHPSYSGLLIFFVGLGLALSNWLSVIVLAVLPAAGLLVRIRSEERALVAALGDDYRRYAATRHRLFPGIWQLRSGQLLWLALRDPSEDEEDALVDGLGLGHDLARRLRDSPDAHLWRMMESACM